MSLNINTITPQEVDDMLKQEKTIHLIDVREDEEVAEGKIPNALHIPLQQIQDRLDEIQKDKEYIIVCRSGNRSGMACEFLQSMGFKTSNMVGGMLNWSGNIE